jgi:glycosyltransferase involved in cell wall biosynthesis
MKTQLTIITVCRNNLKGLKKTADSILSQTKNSGVEWIVVDGNSDDGTKSYLETQPFTELNWISEKDKGLYDAMNKGIRMAKGAYLWFLNAGDTFYEKSTVEQILTQIKSGADVYYGETMLTDTEGKELGLRSDITSRKMPKQLELKSMLGGMVVNHQSVVVKAEICPEFDLKWKIAADYDWMCKVLKKNHQVVNTGLVLSCFESGGLSSKRKKSSWVERYRIMQSHFGYWQTAINHYRILLRATKV